MTEKTSYAPGTPSWIDLGTPDVKAATAFYAGLFGWQHEEAGDPEETMGYGFFTLHGKQVAGVGPLQDPQQPPAWTSYVSVEDADATAGKVRDAGGQVVMEPMDLPADSGRMAVFVDTVGAAICAFQPNQHQGAQLVNEAGAWGWNEHASRDPQTAQRFYGDVFGWEFRPYDEAEGDYWTFHVDGAEGGSGGMMPMGEDWPAEVPAHWAVYFIVEDVNAVAAKAKELGGTVTVEPFDAPPVGRIAVLGDPHGAALSVIAPSEQQGA